MAEERALPNLKSRLTLDSSDIAKVKEQAAGLKQSLSSAGDGAADAGKKLDAGLVNPLKLATTAAGIFAAKKIFDFGKAGFAELADAERVMAQTNATLKATGGVAGVTADDVGNLANKLSGLSGVDDQVVQAGENMLLTFKAVKNQVGDGNDVFNQATQAALDLSTAGFGSMESASVMLGKALQDPIKGVTALQRVGVGFSDSQKETIKQLVATGDVLGAQKIILKEVESQVGGSAKAYGETLPGQLAKAKNSLDDMKASIIIGAAPAINFLAEQTNSAAKAIAGLPEPIRATIGGVGLLAAGFLGVARPLGEVIRLYDRFKEVRAAAAAAEAASAATAVAAAVAAETEAVALARLTASQAASAASAVAATFATEGEQLAMFELTAAGLAAIPVLEADQLALFQVSTGASAAVVATEAQALALAGLTASTAGAVVATEAEATALAGLGAASTAAAVGTSAAGAATGGAAGATKLLTSSIGPYVIAAAAAAAVAYGLYNAQKLSVDVAKASASSTDEITGALKRLGVEKNAGIALEAFQKVAEGNIGTAQRLRDSLAAQGTDVAKLDEILGKVIGSQKQLNADQQAGSDIVDGAAASTKGLSAGYELLLTQTDNLSKAQNALKTSLGSVASALDSAYGRTLDPIKLLSDLEAKTDDLTASLSKNGQTLDLNTEKGRANQAAVLATGEAVARLVEQKFKETGSLVEAQAAGNGYVETLRAQLKAAGLTNTQIEKLIETMHLTPADIATTFSTNAPEVQAIVDALKAHINEIPPEKQTAFLALIDQGAFGEAQRLLDDLARERQVRLVVSAIGFDPSALFNADGSIKATARALGGPVTAGMPYIVGDKNGLANAELFVPKVDGTILPDLPGAWGTGGTTVAPGAVQVSLTVNGTLSPFDEMLLDRRISAITEDAMRRVLA